ncbi:MAG: hypothetical protein CMD18_00730 [Flavobacteriales bacterium]|nr:hypothetical protein [Flavobacteriales bacterium]
MYNYEDKRIESVITIAIAFSVLFAVLSWKWSALVFWPLIISGIILSFGLGLPKVGIIITKAWFKMAQLIGWFSSKIILTLLYCLVIVPYGLFAKFFFSKDILNKKYKESFFIDRNKKMTSEDLENPW